MNSTKLTFLFLLNLFAFSGCVLVLDHYINAKARARCVQANGVWMSASAFTPAFNYKHRRLRCLSPNAFLFLEGR